MAIERAKRQGAVSCPCIAGGDCTGGAGCLTNKAPIASTSCCPSRSSSGSLDISVDEAFPTMLPREDLYKSANGPAAGPVFHLWPPSADIPVALDEAPSVGVPLKRSCCSGRTTPENLALPLPASAALTPAFDAAWPPPPSYHLPAALDASDFSLSLADFTTAAACAGPCRPAPDAMDPVLADLLADPGWLADYSFLDPAPAPSPLSTTTTSPSHAPPHHGCACTSGSPAAPLPASISLEDVCTSCGPACKCGSRCACTRVAEFRVPTIDEADGDVEAILRDFFAQPLVSPARTPTPTPVVESKPRDIIVGEVAVVPMPAPAPAPASSCCCGGGA
jgi:hypothetical protein